MNLYKKYFSNVWISVAGIFSSYYKHPDIQMLRLKGLKAYFIKLEKLQVTIIMIKLYSVKEFDNVYRVN